MKTLIALFALLTFSESAHAEARVRFAYRNPTQGGVAERIDIQGDNDSGGVFIGACGHDGKLCACEFRKDANTIVEKTKPEAVSYDARGNYFQCVFSGKGGPVSFVRITRKNFSTPLFPIKSALTLLDLMGSSLDMNRARQIYRYSCDFNFLQKEGTTTQSFDCTNTFQSCDPDGDPSKNFCLLKSRFPYFLYADNYSSNFHQRVADRLYNGGGSGRLCGMQLKQFNCADQEGTPVRSFGLYGEQVGYWDTSVQLVAGPDLGPTSYGFAARPSATTNECPPGLEKRIFYRVDIYTSDINPSHNFTNGLSATEILSPLNAPSPFQINKLSGGHCDGTRCSIPQSYSWGVKSIPYSKTGQTEFCVIPAELFP